MPKVSVVIPVYGVEKYIERCAKSLFEQTLDDIEYIFVNDCTPDNSIEILKSVLDLYPNRKNIHIYNMANNSGQAAVREFGIKVCTGDYIIHCDSDDWMDTNMLNDMYTNAITHNSDIVVCDYILTDCTSYESCQKGCLNVDKQLFLQDILYQKVPWAIWNKLVRRSLYERLSWYPTNNIGEDMVLSCMLAINATTISYVQKAYYYYYYNPTSIMRNVNKENNIQKYRDLKENTDRLIEFLKSISYLESDNIIPSLKISQCLFLHPYICDIDVYKIWLNEVGCYWRLLFNHNIKSKYKLIYLIIITGVYPLILKCRRLFYECNK